MRETENETLPKQTSINFSSRNLSDLFVYNICSPLI